MTKEIKKQHQQKLAELLEQRRKLLSMPAEKALDEILEAPDALPLAHSFSGEDFYFLIHDIGLDDALPILSMASSSQWEYILDVEGWQRDNVVLNSTLKWFDLLLQADADRFIQWVQNEKLELFEFCLFKTIEVRIREHDEDPGVFGDDFSTLDGIFYFRFVNHGMDDSQEAEFLPEKEEIVLSLLKKLADADHVVYQKILFEFASILPAETEEEIYRLRNVRMAEKGFLPFDEAIGIYQPLQRATEISMQKRMKRLGASRKSTIPLSLYPVSVISGEDLFSRTMNQIDGRSMFSALESEFAVLCNTIIAADQKTIRERVELAGIVEKACGYISVGLQKLSDNMEKPHIESLISLISEYPLSYIFKTGYGLVLELKWRIDRWLKKSWFQKNGLSLGFWGEEWLGVLGGLLLKNPLYFDNYEAGKMYREFTSMTDIQKTEEAVSDIIRFDTLLSVLDISFEPLSSYFVTYKNLLLTVWARAQLGLDSRLLPIEIDRFRVFFQTIFEESPESPGKGTQTGEQAKKRITVNAKTTFVNWISAKTGWMDNEITNRYGSIFNKLFQEIENEYGSVSAKDLDPRYVRLFLLQQDKEETGRL